VADALRQRGSAVAAVRRVEGHLASIEAVVVEKV
jgi:hypothetical protein